MLLYGTIFPTCIVKVAPKPVLFQNRERSIQWAELRGLRRTMQTKMDIEPKYSG